MELNEKIEHLLKENFPDSVIQVETPDQVHFQAWIKSKSFKGLSRIDQQRKVYEVLGDLISSGTVHALSLKTEIME